MDREQGGRARPAPVVYALAIFISAFLLFQVQPLIAKIILPWFGGGAAVWIVCLVFFQVVLLLGYLYAHFLTQVVPSRVQRWVHAGVVAASFIGLEIPPKNLWIPSGPEAPARHILLLLCATVGLPYFLLSSTSPLLQAWYARTHAAVRPYRLYALSNLGSLLALLTYPVLVEPFASVRHQADDWSIVYACAAVLCAAIGFMASGGSTGKIEAASPAPDRRTQILWVALAACGSALLLAITNHITQNVAAVPFLWVVPLSLYLLSFILCFDARRWYRRGLFLRLLGVLLGGMAYSLLPSFNSLPVKVLIPLFCAGLFVCCMFCHGELARLKPDPAHLTRFYLLISAGGAIGAVFVALVAPGIYSGYYELHVALGACGVLVLAVHGRDRESEFRRTRWQPSWLLLIGLVVALLAGLFRAVREEQAEFSLTVRNFYGVLRITGGEAADDAAYEPTGTAYEDAHYRRLMNGTIDHGLQFFAWSRRRWPTSYYGPNSGIGIVLGAPRDAGALRVGMIGLGVGTIAAYGRPGDRITFYEINPLDVELAGTEFTYLRESKAAIDIVMGDARLSLEREFAQNFDVLGVDAFSGDSIPVHLLTRQAFELYFRHLKPNGVLAVHISNKFLNLEPVVASAATALGKEAVLVSNPDDHAQGVYASTWILLGDRAGFEGRQEIEKAGTVLAPGGAKFLWTDDYSSLIRILK